MEVRRYTPSDLEAVIELFSENVPRSFHASEETHLRKHLTSFPETYFLLHSEGLVACGGFTVDTKGGVARLTWDFVRPALHGKGYGSILLKYRIETIKEIPGIVRLEVRTSQMAFKYYQKHGFDVVFSEMDHWAKGYDLIAMVKVL